MNAHSPIFQYIPISDIDIVDDYTSDIRLHEAKNAKFRIEEGLAKWVVTPIGLNEDNKIINITNLSLSYFTIDTPFSLHPGVNYVHVKIDENKATNNTVSCYNNLKKATKFEVIDEPVFSFVSLFPYASGHNLDSMFNSTYMYHKFGLKCKILVLKTDNFYYNLTLTLLKKYFDLEYIFLEMNTNYKFDLLYCVRQYHYLLEDAKHFISTHYLQKICSLHEELGTKHHDAVSIYKYGGNKNNNSNETCMQPTSKHEKYGVHDITNLTDTDLELKIYLLNKAKLIIIAGDSAFRANITDQCISMQNKKIIMINMTKNCVKRLGVVKCYKQCDKCRDELFVTVGNKENYTCNFCIMTVSGVMLNNIKTLDDNVLDEHIKRMVNYDIPIIQ